ncbi:hypothetical protein QAD02_017947 [Eretmocerus hayati]|uniref:Uncharacterized protein n=1 Tax=Eretmocerus hayati TaxID=131215 RepID=A0ACC2PK49_9HYME|nr:hypothetical protein QAD02_017947 [Eretmocerus hayati]
MFFSVSPAIFTQVFTVLGLVKKARGNQRNASLETSGVALPFVYALLSSKATEQYEKVFGAIQVAADQHNIQNCAPTRILSDSEMAIINASKSMLPGVPIKCCFFHFSQALYRKIQSLGLQEEYCTRESTIRERVQMIMGLAYVPVDDVVAVFQIVKANAPPQLELFCKYVEETHVGRSGGRGLLSADFHRQKMLLQQGSCNLNVVERWRRENVGEPRDSSSRMIVALENRYNETSLCRGERECVIEGKE